LSGEESYVFLQGILMNERLFNKEQERLRDPSRLEILEIERVVDLSIDLESLENLLVLDVGTGTGVFAEAFAKRNCRVAGIDINQKMIDEAKRIIPTGNFKLGSAENIPFDKSTFDIVFFGMVLHETDNLLQALTEARRVAKKKAVALEWPYVKGEMGPPLAHRLRSEDVISTAKQAGFKLIEIIALKHLVVYKMTF
jgi:ubiquinone/menaquinone biosynthesis C-methylase UbiE